MESRLTGLVAATFTPMHSDQSLNLGQVKPIVEHLIRSGVSGLYVCGSTGEGPLMTSEERKAAAAAYIEASAGRLPVVVQVGCSGTVEARQLAAHAQEIGATAISAFSPNYFKPANIDALVECLTHIAGGAPKLPFYYYHIPEMSGVNLDMVDLLKKVPDKIPTFAGIKYTASTIDQLQALIGADFGRFDILFGRDEMMLSGLSVGAEGAVGSTYNFAAPLYRQIIAAYQRGDNIEAQRCQGLSVAMVRVILKYRGHAGLKGTMSLLGLDCGPNRLPNVSLEPHELKNMRRELDALGFFQWTAGSAENALPMPHLTAVVRDQARSGNGHREQRAAAPAIN